METKSRLLGAGPSKTMNEVSGGGSFSKGLIGTSPPSHPLKTRIREDSNMPGNIAGESIDGLLLMAEELGRTVDPGSTQEDKACIKVLGVQHELFVQFHVP